MPQLQIAIARGQELDVEPVAFLGVDPTATAETRTARDTNTQKREMCAAPLHYDDAFLLERKPGSRAGTLLPELEITEEERHVTQLFDALKGHWKNVVDVWRRNPIQCASCEILFYEINNVGRWQCWQHACRQEDQKGGITRWPCCGREGSSAKGCVPADHRGKWTPYTTGQNLNMPSAVFTRLRQLHEDTQNFERNEQTNLVEVVRFDREETRRRSRGSERLD